MRADLYLTSRGYVSGREKAKELIEGGNVTLDGKVLKKASDPVNEETEHAVEIRNPFRYVGRGGLKLEAALNAFSLDVEGKTALDIGASTGGFTDCLLQHGAARVFAVDAGEGQLAEKLAADARVISKEHLNARNLSPEDLAGERVDLIVMDVSFISATYLLPRFPELLRESGEAVCLIKPQFEVGKAWIGKGGIVRDPKAHRAAVEQVFAAAEQSELVPVGLIASPITGGDGNREFLAHFCRKATGRTPLAEQTVLKITGNVSGGGRDRNAENRIDYQL